MVYFNRFSNDVDGYGSYVWHDMCFNREEDIRICVYWHDYDDAIDTRFKIIVGAANNGTRSVTMGRGELEFVIRKTQLQRERQQNGRITISRVDYSDDVLIIEKIGDTGFNYVRLSKRCFQRVSNLMREILLDLDSITRYLRQTPSPKDVVQISDKRALRRIVLEVAHKLHRTMCDKQHRTICYKRTPYRPKDRAALQCSRKVWKKLTPGLVIGVLATVGYTSHPSTVRRVIFNSRSDIIQSVWNNGMHAVIGRLAHHRVNINADIYARQLTTLYRRVNEDEDLNLVQ